MAVHPAGKGVDERERALNTVAKWSARVEAAREGYGLALAECRRLSIPNAVIARRVGKSEAAIRMYLGRKARRG